MRRSGPLLGAAALAAAAEALYAALLARQSGPVPTVRALAFGVAIAAVVAGALVAYATGGMPRDVANAVALGAALTVGVLALASFGVLLLAAAGLLILSRYAGSG